MELSFADNIFSEAASILLPAILFNMLMDIDVIIFCLTSNSSSCNVTGSFVTVTISVWCAMGTLSVFEIKNILYNAAHGSSIASRIAIVIKAGVLKNVTSLFVTASSAFFVIGIVFKLSNKLSEVFIFRLKLYFFARMLPEHF